MRWSAFETTHAPLGEKAVEGAFINCMRIAETIHFAACARYPKRQLRDGAWHHFAAKIASAFGTMRSRADPGSRNDIDRMKGSRKGESGSEEPRRRRERLTRADLVAMEIAVRVLTAINECHHPDKKDIERLCRIAPKLKHLPPDELAREIILARVKPVE
jgi:hypothetical protein